jgi:hypothetical protein
LFEEEKKLQRPEKWLDSLMDLFGRVKSGYNTILTEKCLFGKIVAGQPQLSPDLIYRTCEPFLVSYKKRIIKEKTV